VFDLLCHVCRLYNINNSVEICNEDKHYKRNEGDFTIMFDTLLGRSEKIDGIPPGGGLYAK